MLGIPNYSRNSDEYLNGFEWFVWSVIEWENGEMKCDEEGLIVIENM